MKTKLYVVPEKKSSPGLSEIDKCDLLILCPKGDYQKHDAAYQNLLKAIHRPLNESSVVIHLEDHPNSFNEIVYAVQPKSILVFSLTSDELGFLQTYPSYQVLHFEQYFMIFSESFEELNNNKNTKMKLWKLLQQAYIK